MTKHNTEMKALQEEVMKLKDLVKTMKERLGVLEKVVNQVRENERAEIQIEVPKLSEPVDELVISENDPEQKEPDNNSEKESNTSDGKASKKTKHWMNCDLCNYKCKSDNIMKKHIMTKHKNMNKCTLCGNMFKDETQLQIHIESDHTKPGNYISDKDMVTRMEQLHSEMNAEYGGDISDVSLDEEMHAALDREMNPAEYK